MIDDKANIVCDESVSVVVFRGELEATSLKELDDLNISMYMYSQ